MLGALLIACGDDDEPAPDGGVVSEDDASRDASESCQNDEDCDNAVFCDGEEICNPVDEDADGNGCVPADTPACLTECNEGENRCEDTCVDADGDGHADVSCGGDDCDDADDDRYPGNVERCDTEGHDEDCDVFTVGDDGDGDGQVDDSCCNSDGTQTICGQDCNDNAAGINMAAEEICNERDDDCDGNVDEGVLLTFYRDIDGDDFGVMGDTRNGCGADVGYAVAPGDCDDSRAGRNPGAPEVCDAGGQRLRRRGRRRGCEHVLSGCRWRSLRSGR